MDLDAFGHETLHTYQKAIAFLERILPMLTSWDARHVVVSELRRAAESITANLAVAASRESGESRLCSLEYSLGSTGECAACFDVCDIKQLITHDAALSEKSHLAQIARMLHGLHQHWLHGDELKEESPAWIVAPLFAHERLDAFKRALDFVRWFCEEGREVVLPPSRWRDLDKFSTAVVLNIAEGNGRIAKSEQARFWQLALEAGVRAAECIDRLKVHGLLSASDFSKAKSLLRESVALTRGLIRYAKGGNG